MGNIFVYIFNALINSCVALYVCRRLSNNKFNYKSLKFLLCFIVFTIALAINFNLINSYIKVALITIVLILGLKFFLQYSIKEAIVTALTFQTITFLAEFVFSICLFLIFKNNTQLIVDSYIGSALSAVVVVAITLLFSHIIPVNKIYNKLLEITDKIRTQTLVITVFILIISVNLFLASPYYKASPIYIVLMNAVMIIIYSFIVFQFIQEKNRYIEISDKHSLTESSLKELQSNINRLMTVNHENKNQLLTIRAMVANKDKDILKNIDAIIDQKVKDDKYLKEKTSVIANTMLGALVYSKMLTMKDKKIKCSFHIDKQISKIEFINLGDKTNVDVCKIIGTYLDNAIDATVETKNKEVSIDIYLEEAKMIISISNTFKGSVELNRIDESGYTTKSSGHGYGLALAREIIKNNRSLTSETEILDNVFIQKLKIKM